MKYSHSVGGVVGANIEQILPTLKFIDAISLEKQMGFVKNIYQKNDKYYLDINYVQWLNNQDCTKLGLGGNGYCIINYNLPVRTIEIDPNAAIKKQLFRINATGQLAIGVGGEAQSNHSTFVCEGFQ